MDQPAEPSEGGSSASPEDSQQDSQSWEDLAAGEQQKYFEYFGDRLFDSYRQRLPSICQLLLDNVCECLESDGFCDNQSEMTVLKRKIGFALFREPIEEPNEENSFTGYEKEKMKSIEKVYDKILKFQEKKVLMALLFVTVERSEKKRDVVNYAVFRIPSNTGKENEFFFVDCLGRVYKTWDDFLKNNKLPAGKLCYPKDGVYSGGADGRVEVSFGFTPAARLGGKVLRAVDVAAAVTGVGSGVGIFFPPIAIACIGTGIAVSCYSVVRSSFELADKGQHGESLRDREAFRHWLSMFGSTLGLGSSTGMAAVRFLAQEGRDASRLVCGIVTGLNYSSMLVNGVSIVEGIITIKEQEEWSALQCFQVATSVVFFAHSIVNFKTARTVYAETQTQILEQHGASLSRRQRRLFDGLQKETLKGEANPMVGRAKIIKDLKHISNKNEFFSQIFKSNKAARKNSEPVKKFKFGSQNFAQDGQAQSSASVFTRPTAGLSNSMLCGSVPSNSSSEYISPHEPILFTKIRDLIRRATAQDVQHLMLILENLCSRSELGKKLMWVFRIIIDFKNCNNWNQFYHLLREVIDFVVKLWEEAKESRGVQSSPDESFTAEERRSDPSGVQTDEDIMNDILQDADFIPSFLHACDIDEEVFHFPLSHRAWGEHGELYPEEYIAIGQNIFGIAKVDSAKFMCDNNTATVYFENFGFATITSYVSEQKIVVKKYKNE